LLGFVNGFFQNPFMPFPAKPEAPRHRMLSDVVHEKLRAGHYSRRTEEAYLGWIRRFIRLCAFAPPR